VLAFFFTSALVAGVAAADDATGAELEAHLAVRRDVYLVVRIDSGRIAIRVRGTTLEELQVASVLAHERRRLTDASEADPVRIPRLFVTAATISLVDRKVVAPDRLEPWSEEANGRALAAEDARPVPPSSYDVPLEGGWVLEIRQEEPALSGTRRFVAAVADGWDRLTGSKDDDRRPAIRVVLDERSAARLHHLFKKGTGVLFVDE